MGIQDITVIILDVLMAIAFIFYTLVFPAKLSKAKKSEQDNKQ